MYVLYCKYLFMLLVSRAMTGSCMASGEARPRAAQDGTSPINGGFGKIVYNWCFQAYYQEGTVFSGITPMFLKDYSE
jgi:hypothetical protein